MLEVVGLMAFDDLYWVRCEQDELNGGLGTGGLNACAKHEGGVKGREEQMWVIKVLSRELRTRNGTML